MDPPVRSDNELTEINITGPRSEQCNSSGRWPVCGQKFPKSEIVFFFQVILVYIVVIVSIVNLSIGQSDEKLWITLLSSSIGYLLPNPNLNKNNYV